MFVRESNTPLKSLGKLGYEKRKTVWVKERGLEKERRFFDEEVEGLPCTEL